MSIFDIEFLSSSYPTPSSSTFLHQQELSMAAAWPLFPATWRWTSNSPFPALSFVVARKTPTAVSSQLLSPEKYN